MTYFAIGFLLATVGITIINCVCDIMSTFTELIKSIVGVKIVKNNEIVQNQEESKIRAIGFATTFEEEDNDYDD